jgi:MFS transporter, PPP family, 3-phenylpropionic acid transporter
MSLRHAPRDDALPERSSFVPSALVYWLLFTAVGCWSAYASVFFQDLGVGLAAIGLLASVPAAVAIVGAPVWGLIADRLGDVRPPLLIAALWAAAAAALLALRPEQPWLTLIVVLTAAGTSGLTPLVDARTVQRLGRDRERFGQARVFGSISFVVASLGVGLLVQATSSTAMLLVYVPALAATGIVGAALLGRDRRPARAAGIGPLRALHLLRDPRMGLFFVGSVVVWTAATGVMAFFSLRLIELGGDARLVGVGWAANALLEIPMMLAFRRVAVRVPVERLVVLGAAIFAARAALWAVTGSATAVVVVAALGGTGFALFLVGTTTWVASRAPVGMQVTAQALFSGTAFALGSILGALIAGLIAGAWGLAALFPLAAVGSAVGAVLVWIAIVAQAAPAHEAGRTADGRQVADGAE